MDTAALAAQLLRLATPQANATPQQPQARAMAAGRSETVGNANDYNSNDYNNGGNDSTQPQLSANDSMLIHQAKLQLEKHGQAQQEQQRRRHQEEQHEEERQQQLQHFQNQLQQQQLQHLQQLQHQLNQTKVANTAMNGNGNATVPIAANAGTNVNMAAKATGNTDCNIANAPAVTKPNSKGRGRAKGVKKTRDGLVAGSTAIPKIYRSGEPQFPWMLHRLLADVEKHNRTDIISWMPCGRAFMVHSRDLFLKYILPNYVRQSRFKSFARSLNLWGFTTCRKCCGERLRGAYFNPLFIRGAPTLSHKMVRTKIKHFKSRPSNACKFCDYRRENPIDSFPRDIPQPCPPNETAMTTMPRIMASAPLRAPVHQPVPPQARSPQLSPQPMPPPPPHAMTLQMLPPQPQARPPQAMPQQMPPQMPPPPVHRPTQQHPVQLQMQMKPSPPPPPSESDSSSIASSQSSASDRPIMLPTPPTRPTLSTAPEVSIMESHQQGNYAADENQESQQPHQSSSASVTAPVDAEQQPERVPSSTTAMATGEDDHDRGRPRAVIGAAAAPEEVPSNPIQTSEIKILDPRKRESWTKEDYDMWMRQNIDSQLAREDTNGNTVATTSINVSQNLNLGMPMQMPLLNVVQLPGILPPNGSRGQPTTTLGAVNIQGPGTAAGGDGGSFIINTALAHNPAASGVGAIGGPMVAAPVTGAPAPQGSLLNKSMRLIPVQPYGLYGQQIQILPMSCLQQIHVPAEDANSKPPAQNDAE